MSIEAEKIRLVRIMLDTNDKKLIKEMKTLVSKHTVLPDSEKEKEKFSNMMSDAMNEIKLHREGKTDMQTASEFLNEL